MFRQWEHYLIFFYFLCFNYAMFWKYWVWVFQLMVSSCRSMQPPVIWAEFGTLHKQDLHQEGLHGCTCSSIVSTDMHVTHIICTNAPSYQHICGIFKLLLITACMHFSLFPSIVSEKFWLIIPTGNLFYSVYHWKLWAQRGSQHF